MKKVIIYYRDGSRQVVTPLQESEKPRNPKDLKKYLENSKNFCGDWHGLVQAITYGNYLKYEVI